VHSFYAALGRSPSGFAGSSSWPGWPPPSWPTCSCRPWPAWPSRTTPSAHGRRQDLASAAVRLAGPDAALTPKGKESCDTERPAVRDSRSRRESVYD